MKIKKGWRILDEGLHHRPFTQMEDTPWKNMPVFTEHIPARTNEGQLTNVLRQGASARFAKALEAELEEFLAGHTHNEVSRVGKTSSAMSTCRQDFNHTGIGEVPVRSLTREGLRGRVVRVSQHQKTGLMMAISTS